jgi:hypothetical protein
MTTYGFIYIVFKNDVNTILVLNHGNGLHWLFGLVIWTLIAFSKQNIRL